MSDLSESSESDMSNESLLQAAYQQVQLELSQATAYMNHLHALRQQHATAALNEAQQLNEASMTNQHSQAIIDIDNEIAATNTYMQNLITLSQHPDQLLQMYMNMKNMNELKLQQDGGGKGDGSDAAQPDEASDQPPTLAEVDDEIATVNSYLTQLSQLHTLIEKGEKGTKENPLPSLDELTKEESMTKRYLDDLQQLRQEIAKQPPTQPPSSSPPSPPSSTQPKPQPESVVSPVRSRRVDEL